MRAQWDEERDAIEQVRDLRQQVEQLRQEVEHAERDYDLDRAAELRHGQLPTLENEIRERSALAKR